MLAALRALERRLLSAEKACLTLLLCVMVLLSFAQVVLRGAFSVGLLWADTFLRHLVLWVGFLGAAAASGEDKQFSLEIVSHSLKGRTLQAARSLSSLFALAACLLLTRAAFKMLQDERAAGGVLFSLGDAHVPAWPFELILPLGFALLSLHYVLKLVQAAARPNGA